MKFLKMFVIAVFIGLMFFWTTPVLPGTAEGIGNVMGYRIVTIATDLKESLKHQEWTICGDYFARIETEEQDTVFFYVEKKSPGGFAAGTKPNFSNVEWVDASINEKLSSPMLTILRNGWDIRYRLQMNAEDYKAGLPCFGRGTKI